MDILTHTKLKEKLELQLFHAGYMNGVNITNDRDMFRIVDRLRYIIRDVKDFFKKQDKYIKINNQNCKILGRIGTYHVVCDVTNKDVEIGNKAIFNVNTKFVDSSIKREYRQNF